MDFWNAGVGDAVENSVKRLVDNGYTATVTMIFKGKYSASGSYTVKTTCKSLQEVSDLCNEASSFFGKSITSSNAGSEYNEVNKRLENRLTLSLSSLNYSNYTSSSNPVFVFNDSVSGAVCKHL